METFQVRDLRTEKRFFVDNIIIDEYGSELGSYGIAVYNVLCRFARLETQQAYPSVSTIANRIDAGTTKVREELRLLEELELIRTERRRNDKGQTSNLYTLLEPPKKNEDHSTPHEVSPQRHTLGASTPRVDEQSLINNNKTVVNPPLTEEEQDAFDALISADFTPRDVALRYAKKYSKEAVKAVRYAKHAGLRAGWIRNMLDRGSRIPDLVDERIQREQRLMEDLPPENMDEW